MKYWWDADICACCNEKGDVAAAYSYWSEKLFELTDNPYTCENSVDIFSSLVCDSVSHRGVAGFLIEFFTGADVNSSDKDILVTDICNAILDGKNVEEWMLKEITPMKGDIYLILNLLVKKGVLIHTLCRTWITCEK